MLKWQKKCWENKKKLKNKGSYLENYGCDMERERQMIKLSFILPVYNVEKYIEDCLESLLNQNISETMYEIICVNDGSTDNSERIIRNYMENHSNITLISKENGGVSKARNEGLKASSGKYVWFVDPDDYIVANCIKDIIDALDRNEADVFDCCYKRCNDEDRVQVEMNEKVIIVEKNHQLIQGAVWMYVCKRDYLLQNKIMFHTELRYGEDWLWTFQLKTNEHKSIYSKNKLYVYRKRKGSAYISNEQEKQENYMHDMELLCQLYEDEKKRLILQNMPKRVKQIERRKALAVQGILMTTIKNGKEWKDVRFKIEKLRQNGLYPYRIQWKSLIQVYQIKSYLINVMCLFFPFEWYLHLFFSMTALKRNGEAI